MKTNVLRLTHAFQWLTTCRKSSKTLTMATKNAQDAAKLLSGKSLKLTAKAGQGGRLFGSVTTKEVAEELKKQFGLDIEKRKIAMADIKAFGSYEAEIKFSHGITAKITVMVSE